MYACGVWWQLYTWLFIQAFMLCSFFLYLGTRYYSYMPVTNIAGCGVGCLEGRTVVGIGSSFDSGYGSGIYFRSYVTIGSHHGRDWCHVRHGKTAKWDGRPGERFLPESISVKFVGAQSIMFMPCVL